jgi:hypothetical protein
MLIQTALQSAASVELGKNGLRIIFAPLSSKHRSKAIAAMCQGLNRFNTIFLGTNLRMHSDVIQDSK